ncbi:MAG: MBL fold metallo-hydrolase [Treponema sp.]|nr:MBL fold metallo-hydrolase [Treponema sp.]
MSGTKFLALPLITLGSLAAAGQTSKSAELTYFGRATVKIRTASGFVLYIDPYAPGDYSEPADLVLVSHGHGDHNRVDLVKLKPGAVVASAPGAVSGKGIRYLAEGDSFQAGPVTVQALPASNKNHRRGETLGFLVSFDGIVVYHASDTNYLPEMEGFAKYGIGYALLPCDGFYNMGPEEASRCAAAVNARAVLPIHSSKSELFDGKNARAVRGPEVIALEPGQSTPLRP